MSDLKKLNEAEVISSDGFRLKYGKDTLIYIAEDKYMIVPIEHVGAPYEMVVYMNAAGEWMEKGVPVGSPSKTDLDGVEQRIRYGLAFLKRNFSIIR